MKITQTAARVLPINLLATAFAIAHATNVTPQRIADNHYQFNSNTCHLQLDINPTIGGRIAGLKMDKQIIVKPYACDLGEYNPRSSCNGSGSVFWTSPQREWPMAPWPPVVSLDGAAYSVQIKRHHVVLAGPSDDALGASVEKEIALDEAHCSINLRYTLKASRSVSLAPWEITRVPRGGIALFPVGDKSHLTAGPLAPRMTLTHDETIAWFDDTGIPDLHVVGGSKLVADGSKGWLAYVREKYLFIKKFDDVPVESLAPNEGDIEIYAGDTFLELEQQGRYTAMKEYDQLPWNVSWRVVKVPKTVKVAAGSDSLLKFVREQVGVK